MHLFRSSLRSSLSLAKNSFRTLTCAKSNVEQYSNDYDFPVRPVAVKTSTVGQNRTVLISNLVWRVNTITGQNIKASNFSSYERLILVLLASENRTKNFDNLLKEEVMSKLDTLRPKFIPKILSELLRNKCMNKPVLRASSERVVQLIEEDNLPDDFNFGRIFWVFGKRFHYDESLCNSLLSLINRRKDILTPWMMGNIAWYCARIRYYNPTLLDKITSYTLQNLDKFPQLQMSNVVYTLGSLNHNHAELMDAIWKKLESEYSLSNHQQVYWMYMWTSMVLGVIKRETANRLLNNQFIKGSMLNGGFYLIMLLQLSIAVNYEYKNLGLSGIKSFPGKWGQGFDSIHNVHVEHIQNALLSRLDQYRTGDSFSVFAQNVKRALSQIVGEDFFNAEAMSLSGYIMDFEILLDSNNKPVRIPRRWKKQWKDSVVKSINPTRCQGHVKKTITKVSSLIEKLETAETKTEFEATKKAVLDSNFDLRMRINLASDWGSKFEAVPEGVAKRIAIEADGYIHFAANCDHVLGRTVLKHKQLRALGWEVMQIPYREWEQLPDGDAHVDYLADKISGI